MKQRDIIIINILIIAAILLCGTVLVSADGYDKYGIYVNGKKLDQNINVQNFDGFDYVPLNKLAVNLDITVKENKDEDVIYIVTSFKNIKIINKNKALIDGETEIQLDIPVKLQDNNVYFPVLYLVDLLEYQVDVMDDIKCISIKTPSNKILVGKLIDAELNKNLPPSKAVSSSYPRVTYLTFDDGPSSKVTTAILDILKEENVKATFFITGKNIERNKDLLKRMIEEGHSIGNHTYTHMREIIYTSAEGLKNEIEKTNEALFKAVGIRTKLFRPPYGGPYVKSKEMQAVLTPYRTILWNVDSMDSRSAKVTSAEIVKNVIDQVKKKKSAIIIMHDSATHMETAKALPEIIKYLKDNGFTILPIREDTSISY